MCGSYRSPRVVWRCFLSERNNICIGPVNCWRTHKSNTKGITLALRNSETFPGISKSNSLPLTLLNRGYLQYQPVTGSHVKRLHERATDANGINFT